MPLVRVKNGEAAGSTFEVGEAPLIIGRDERAEIPLPDQGVSRRHAELYRIGEMYFIRDLSSRNGTFVNEERVQEELLRHGDEFRIASIALSFEDSNEASAYPGLRRRNRVRVSPSSDATTTIQIDEHLARDLEDLAEPTREEHSRDLQLLYRCSRLLAEARDPTQLAEELAALAGDAFRADHACLFLRKDGSRELELEAGWQPSPLPQQQQRRAAPVVSSRAILEVVQTKRSVLRSDERRGPSPDPKASMLGHGRPTSVMAAPLVAMDQVHGVLYCASHDPHRFGTEALDLMTSMALQAGIAIQSLLLTQRQERVLVATVRTLSTLLEMRDPIYTGHSARVAATCAAIARSLKLPRAESRRIQLAALLHNVAKIVLPPGIPDDESDPEILRKRNEISEKLIRRIEGLEFVLPVIQTYHEHMDGSGLPDGLPGERIPLAARILAVADHLDTLMVKGEPPLGLEEALDAVRRTPPGRFDPRVVDALMASARAGHLQQQQPAPPPTP